MPSYDTSATSSKPLSFPDKRLVDPQDFTAIFWFSRSRQAQDSNLSIIGKALSEDFSAIVF
jgi:hypothetical protein